MKAELGRNKNEIKKRLTAMLVAVIFVLGTAVVPSEIYAVETDDQVPAVSEAVEPEAVAEDVAEATEEQAEGNPESVENEAAGQEEQEEAEEADAAADLPDLSGLVIAVDENGDSVGLEEISEDEYDGFLYKVKDDTTKSEIKEMENAIDELEEEQEVEEVVDKELYAADSIETIGEVAEPEQIEYIEPNYILKAFGTPNDKLYNEYGWYLKMTNAPYVWDRGEFGEGATVAVLDTGVKKNHKDFNSDTFVMDRNCIKDTTDVKDNVGHGTAVTGIIAAAYNNGEGMTGIMPEAKIMPVKVMDVNGSGDATGTAGDIIEGIDYAAGNGADVINMSLGDKRNIVSLHQACQRAAARGVILVAAAGNEAQGDGEGSINPVEYPASYDCVVSVASIERNGYHSDFSNYNNYVAVSAPGRGLAMPWINWTQGGLVYNYVTNTGTSFSAPQVSAMAAMVKSMDKSVNITGFMDIIASTSVDKGSAGYDAYFGYGLMDLSNVYRYMKRDLSLFRMSLSGTSFTYDGNVKTPSVTVSWVGRALSAANYTVSYDPGRAAIGTYKVTVAGRGSFTGKKTLSFNVVPPLVKKIKTPKRYKKKLQVRWKAMSKKQKKKYKSVITGYQVRVSTSSNFSNAKYASVKGLKKTKLTVKGLKRKTKYYVQYRSYKTVGSVNYYSKWSGTKKAKTK